MRKKKKVPRTKTKKERERGKRGDIEKEGEMAFFYERSSNACQIHAERSASGI